MSYPISSILQRIATRLNDRQQKLYTDEKLLPLVQDAADELQLELELNGLLVLEKIWDPITIPQGTTHLGRLIPDDLLEPQRLDERLAGSTDLFYQMIGRMWPPNVQPTDSLRYWDYREEDIHFVGATTDREIKIYGLKNLVKVIGVESIIPVNNSKPFMISRSAGLAARFLGANPTRADALDNEAILMLNKLTGIGVKSKQRTRTRRRPFVLAGRRRLG